MQRNSLIYFKKKITDYFSNQPEVIAVYLFGSYMKGRLHPHSDLDVAVLCTPKDGTHELYRLEMKYFRELSRIIPRNLDIVILNRAGELLVYEVLSRGELIYQRDSAKRVEFEARRIADYLDFAPMMNRMRRGMMNKLKQRVYHG